VSVGSEKDLVLNRREFLHLGFVSAAVPVGSSPGRAQSDYPDHAVRLIVPRPAGGVVDIIAREWTSAVGSAFSPTVIENVVGGGGTIGAALAARATPDGYTLLFGTTSELVLSPILPNLSYSVASFGPIAIICESIASIVVNPSVPVTNLRELVAYAKSNPGRLSYGSAGAGTVSNLAGELFKRLADCPDITHVPYRGGNPAMTDVIAGHVPIATPMMSETILEMHRRGEIRILAVASDRRLAAMPDIQTGVEQGYPGFIARLFVGLFAPANTPAPVVAKVAEVTRQAMQSTVLKERFAAAGFQVLADVDTAAAARYIGEEVARWTPIVQQVGLPQE
jgi:tripartite-type tricarboxylate transporter receptor subunit TctC